VTSNSFSIGLAGSGGIGGTGPGLGDCPDGEDGISDQTIPI
jgi:hypothetical protein